ncbi:MAG: GTP-dependent dephospho-CoA kinase family protein [Candidatus Odinarchaeia archaeon]
MKKLKLTPKAEKKLKKPLGILLEGPPLKVINEFKKMMKEDNPPKIITVGDVVTQNLIKAKVIPDIYIIDNKTLRKDFKPELDLTENIKIKNEKGSINPLIWGLITDILKSDLKNGILVDGEEDLLAIPCVLKAPINSYVIYGQPNEGMVVIKVNEQIKEKFRRILNEMEEVKDGV